MIRLDEPGLVRHRDYPGSRGVVLKVRNGLADVQWIEPKGLPSPVSMRLLEPVEGA